MIALNIFKELHIIAEIILWGNAFYHGVMGLFCIIDYNLTAKAMKFLYRADLKKDINAKFLYVVKPLGAFAITISIVNIWIALYGTYELKVFFLRTIALLYFLRLYFRYNYYDLLFKAFEVKKKTNYINIGFNATLIILIIITTLP
jgi:hypothetical protein